MMPVVIGMIYFHLNPELSIDDGPSTKSFCSWRWKHLNPFFATPFRQRPGGGPYEFLGQRHSGGRPSVLGYNGYKFFNPNADEVQNP